MTAPVLADVPSALPRLPEGGDHLPAGTPGYTFRRDVPEVRLQFTVADEQGRVVQDLSPAEVRIFDNQSPVARFNDFERAQDLPAATRLDSRHQRLRQTRAARGESCGR